MKSILTFIALAIAFASTSQTIHTVDKNPTSGAQFVSIQDAVDAASAGDYIYVHPYTGSYGNVVITKTLHFRGLGHHPALNNGENAVVAEFKLNASGGASGTTISGMEFDAIVYQGNVNADYSGIQIINNRITGFVQANANFCDDWLIQGNLFVVNDNSVFDQENHLNWIIVNNVFQNAATDWSWNTFISMNSSTTFRNNLIFSHQNNNALVYMFNNTDGLSIDNCIFLFSSAIVEEISGSNFTNSTFNNCLTYNLSGGTLWALSGSDNLDNMDPMFLGNVDAWFDYSDDFHLDPLSPAVGNGINGGDLGIYGNEIEFSMEGYPMDLPYPTEMIINTTSVNSGANLEVEFKAKGN
jgi:hypothetical protein